MFTRKNNATNTLALALAAASLAALSGSAPGAITQCEWNAGTTTQTTTCGSWTMTSGGVFWDTWSRKCTHHKEGDATWCTYILIRQCTAGGGIGVGVTPQGPSGEISGEFSYTWVPHVTNCTTGTGTADWCTTETKCVGFWESDPTNGPSSSQAPSKSKTPDPEPRPDDITYVYNVVNYSNDTIFNGWSSSTVTWDGILVPYNAAIPLSQQALGAHVYTVVPDPALNTGVAAFIFNIDLQSSFDLQQVDEFRDIVPMATFSFTNNSEYAIDVDFRAEPALPGLQVEVFNNQQHVLSGETITLTAEFYSEDGYAFTPGATIPCPIKVYDFYAPGAVGTVLAQTTLQVHEPCTGDLTADGTVNAADVNEVLRQIQVNGDISGDPAGAARSSSSVLTRVIDRIGAKCFVSPLPQPIGP